MSYKFLLKWLFYLLAIASILFLLTGCSMESRGKTYGDSLFTNRDFDEEYDTQDAVIIDFKDDSPLISIPEGTAECVRTEPMSKGENVIIEDEGTYIIEGTAKSGAITVDAHKDSKVQLVLRGVDITCAEQSCIYVKNADKVFVTLDEDTENILRDSNITTETSDKGDEEEKKIDSVIYSEDDLVFQGKGKLLIEASVRDAIICDNDIKITNGSYDIKAKHTAVTANDSIRIAGGRIRIESDADALHVEEGYFYTREAEIDIKCEDDAIHSLTELTIADGKVNIEKCREGLEGHTVEIYGGTIDITSDDDSINAYGKGDIHPFVRIYGGTLSLVSQGDCLDSNGPAYIEDGDVYMFSSAEDADGAVDTIEGFTILGGDIIAVESSGITDADIAKSNIKKLSVTMDETCKADTPFQVKDSTGETLYIVTPEGDYKNIFVCSPKIKEGKYTISAGQNKKDAESR